MGTPEGVFIVWGGQWVQRLPEHVVQPRPRGVFGRIPICGEFAGPSLGYSGNLWRDLWRLVSTAEREIHPHYVFVVLFQNAIRLRRTCLWVLKKAFS